MDIMYLLVGGSILVLLIDWVTAPPPLDDRRLLKAYCTYVHYKKTKQYRTYFCEGNDDGQER